MNNAFLNGKEREEEEAAAAAGGGGSSSSNYAYYDGDGGGDGGDDDDDDGGGGGGGGGNDDVIEVVFDDDDDGCDATKERERMRGEEEEEAKEEGRRGAGGGDDRRDGTGGRGKRRRVEEEEEEEEENDDGGVEDPTIGEMDFAETAEEGEEEEEAGGNVPPSLQRYDVPLSPPRFPEHVTNDSDGGRPPKRSGKRSADHASVEAKRQKTHQSASTAAAAAVTTDTATAGGEGRGREEEEEEDSALYGRFQSFSEFKEGSWYVVGPPGSGKTAILKTFLWDTYRAAKTAGLRFYPNYTTTIREELANFKKIIPRQLVSAHFKVPVEKRITEWLNENFEKEKKVVVIYDDICSDDKGRGSKKVSAWSTYQSELVRFGSRHYKAHYLITTQYYTVIDTTTRSSFTYSMCICKMGDVVDLGAESVTKRLREMATIFKCDVDQLVTLIDTVNEKEDFNNSDRLVIVYHNQNKTFRWTLHRRPAPETDEMKRYIDDYLLEVPQCFIKNGAARLANMRRAEKQRHGNATAAGGGGGDIDNAEEENEWEDLGELGSGGGGGGGEDLEKELSKITMLQSISQMNPKVYELLSKSKRLDIIEREYLKAKAMSNLRNKLNIFMILYDLVFVIIEYVDRRLQFNQCEGLTRYRDGMTEDDKNTERDIVNSVIEYYTPYLNQPSPLTDLTLHTVTVILLAKAHNSMSRIVNTVASQLDRCDERCKRTRAQRLRTCRATIDD
uniref:Packaging ATPase n=1 Tax=Panulirus argus virus 1 TaxID=380624 RepID=A0A6G9HDK8_9VIRU|nr:packaging ATPase [Panulirus argus virus 1]